MIGLAATRRRLIGGGAALATAAAVAGRALAADAPPFDVHAPQPDDMALGNPKAPVTVIEYASVGCPHCGKWANEVFPAFKARFIDTGKVRFVLREIITGQPTLATAGFMLARCAGPANYFKVVEGVFAKQPAMFNGEVTPVVALGEIAKSVGIDDAAFQACLTSDANLKAVNERSERHGNVDRVGSTPTFFIGAQKFDTEMTLDQLSAAIAAAARKRPPARRHRR